MNSALHLLGIARKAGRVEIGEEPVAAAVRAGHGRLVLVASDAAGNSVRRAARFAESSGAPWVQTPFSKAELGQAVGRASCAMLAITDFGLASAVAGRLAALDQEKYGAVAAALEKRAAKALQRQKERQAHEKNLRQGKRKPWAAPPPDRKSAPSRRPETAPGRRPPAKAESAGRRASSAGEKAKTVRSVPKGVVTVKAVHKRRNAP